MPRPDRPPLEHRRWAGAPGRLEVWYDTVTDPATGTALWLHHELVAPTDGEAAYAHGWAAVFAPDEAPRWERFGPEPVRPGTGFAAGDVRAEPGTRAGRAGNLGWDLSYRDSSLPLYTFPAATWRREILPAAQIVPSPRATFDGTVRVGERTMTLDRAIGAAARIYGHGNAARWAWLHADLGDGDVLEVVAAVPHRPGLDRLPALPLVQLRTGGRDWPTLPLLGAARFRCTPTLPRWSLSGRVGDRRLRVDVTQPAERCVTVPYRDPDGSTATCTNTERADAVVVLERRRSGRWATEREWRLDATAHAEVGLRP